MKRALPVNSSRFMSGETLGMKRLRINPAMNAPKMPSRPIIWESAPQRNRMLKTKINCITASL